VGAANATKHVDLVFSCVVRAMLDSNDMWPCPTLHSLGDKEGTDSGFPNTQTELPGCFSQRHCEEESTRDRTKFCLFIHILAQENSISRYTAY